MKKVIVFLADGFEEVEALTVVDYLRRVDIQVDMVSISDSLEVKGAHDVVVQADLTIDALENVDSYDGIIVPGGMPGASNIRDEDKCIDLVKDFDSKDKLLAAICAGPIVLNRAGIIDGKKITAYPGFENDLSKSQISKAGVERDGNIVTGKGPIFAVDFAVEIVDYLLGHKAVKELKTGILYEER